MEQPKNKGGRPKKEETLGRKHGIHIRLSQAQRTEIEEMMNNTGHKQLKSFVMEAIRQYGAPESEESGSGSADISETRLSDRIEEMNRLMHLMFAEIKTQGANINQAVKIIHSLKYKEPDSALVQSLMGRAGRLQEENTSTLLFAASFYKEWQEVINKRNK